MTQVLVRLVADILDYLRLSIWQAPPTLAATTYTSSRLKIMKIPIPHVRPIHTLQIEVELEGETESQQGCKMLQYACTYLY